MKEAEKRNNQARPTSDSGWRGEKAQMKQFIWFT